MKLVRAGHTGLILFIAALVPRLLASHFLSGEPVWDGHYYDFGARRIAAGFGYSDDVIIGGVPVWHPWCHYPVGYSAFLGFFYWIFGDGTWVPKAVDVVVSSLLPVATWLLARHGLSETRARVAGALVAFHPGLIVYSALVMTEPLAALATLLAFWLCVRDRSPRRGIVLGALMLGLSALVRPQALLCAPFLALRLDSNEFWKETESNSKKTASRWAVRALWAAVACGVALVPVLPWTARNCRVMDGCALVSTNAGWNLAIGAFPRATGRFETLRSSDGCREVTGQVQQDRCWLHYGIDQIQSEPSRWLSLIPAKLSYTFDHESFPVEYLREARPRDWPEPRRIAARELLTATHRLLTVFALFGCIAFVRRGRGVVAQGLLASAAALLALWAISSSPPVFWPLVVVSAIIPWLPLPGRAPWQPALWLPVSLLATTIVAHAVFFGEDRYHMVVTPVLCMLAACAWRRGS